MIEVDEADVVRGHRRALRVAGRQLAQVDLAGQAVVVPLRDAPAGLEHAVAQAGREHGDQAFAIGLLAPAGGVQELLAVPEEPWNMNTTGARAGRSRGT